MNDPTFEVPLLLAASTGILTTLAGMLFAVDRLRPSLFMTAWLSLATLAELGLVATTVWRGHWFFAVPAVGLGLLLVAQWNMHLGARRGDGGRLLALIARRFLTRQSPRVDGRPLRPMDDLRAEYGQGILDDSRRDPTLAHLLDQAAATLDDRLFGKGRSKELPLIRIEAYTNGLVDALSEPGRAPSQHRYRGYSSDMILIAALCQLYDRYDEVDSRT
ncbi:hypothetical protein GA0070616_0077 [Micromonospora nigra]|uniref:Uncharacterized protein n=1 Tax=Micromonospora nigra TaxID=145857 RepID=A0A1C6R7E0_9ACTN|nr:DUF6401 family natural product biosynthesis protein [Micromonospora nigra]SCL12956.1 hypothetical protein GA0070616_0077 [Micromonospora nigra]